MESKDCQWFLVTGTYIFGKSCKFNNHTATKKQMACIKDKLKRLISDQLLITGEKKIAIAQ